MIVSVHVVQTGNMTRSEHLMPTERRPDSDMSQFRLLLGWGSKFHTSKGDYDSICPMFMRILVTGVMCRCNEDLIHLILWASEHSQAVEIVPQQTITYSTTEPVKPPNRSKCLGATNLSCAIIIIIIRTS